MTMVGTVQRMTTRMMLMITTMLLMMTMVMGFVMLMVMLLLVKPIWPKWSRLCVARPISPQLTRPRTRPNSTSPIPPHRAPSPARSASATLGGRRTRRSPQSQQAAHGQCVYKNMRRTHCRHRLLPIDAIFSPPCVSSFCGIFRLCYLLFFI